MLAPAAGDAESRRAAEAVARELQAALHGFTFSVGYSRVAHDPVDLYRAGNEALLAANVAEAQPAGEERDGDGPAVLAFEETGAYRLLLPAMSEDPGELQRFYAETVEPLVAYDEQYETDLVQTLETFLDCDGNVANTAPRLFTHRHTIRYRLERVRDLSGLDVSSTDGREKLGLGLKAMRVLGIAAPRGPGRRERGAARRPRAARRQGALSTAVRRLTCDLQVTSSGAMAAPVPTLYEWAGGEPALLRLTRGLLRPASAPTRCSRRCSPRCREEHPQHVATWLGEVFGGPPRYTEEHGGYPHMLAKHRNRALTEEQRLRWVQLICTAADEAGLPDDPEFRSAFVAYVEWGTRLALANSQPGATPPPEAPVPRWGWGEAPPYVRVNVGSAADGDRHHHRLGNVRAARVRGQRAGAGRDASGARRSSRAGRSPASTSRTSPATAPATCGSPTTSPIARTSARWRELGVDAVLAVTVCGAVDPGVELGSLICFDDLHFPANRLPDGSLCTFFSEPGDPRRGHWIYEDPYAPRAARARCSRPPPTRGLPMRDGGCYGHVDGPRFNTRAEIRGLAAAGVTAVSQTAGPETVLAGEAELPFALVGYATDYANGVQAEATPVERLLELIAASTDDVRARCSRRRCRGSTATRARAGGHRLPLPRGVTAPAPARARARPRAGRPGRARPASRRCSAPSARAALQALLIRARRRVGGRCRARRRVRRRRRHAGRGARAGAAAARRSPACCARGRGGVRARDGPRRRDRAGRARAAARRRHRRARGSAPRTPRRRWPTSRAGCDIVFGATLEGGWYLAGLREPRPELLARRARRCATGGIGAVLGARARARRRGRHAAPRAGARDARRRRRAGRRPAARRRTLRAALSA